MRLFPEQRRLDVIDGTLRAEAPRLAAKFDMFARLARDEGEPPPEMRLRPARGGPERFFTWFRRRVRLLRALRLRPSLYAGVPHRF